MANFGSDILGSGVLLAITTKDFSVMYYVLYFLAGAFAANAVPHFVKGVTGESFQTPFGRPSSAVVNVAWAAVNLLIAWGLWHYAGVNRAHVHSIRYDLAFGLGGLVGSLLLAWLFSHRKK